MLRSPQVASSPPLKSVTKSVPCGPVTGRASRTGEIQATRLAEEAHRADVESAGWQDLQAQPAVERDVQDPRVIAGSGQPGPVVDRDGGPRVSEETLGEQVCGGRFRREIACQ